MKVEVRFLDFWIIGSDGLVGDGLVLVDFDFAALAQAPFGLAKTVIWCCLDMCRLIDNVKNIHDKNVREGVKNEPEIPFITKWNFTLVTEVLTTLLYFFLEVHYLALILRSYLLRLF